MLTLKHSFQDDDVEFSSLATGSRVPAFNTRESRVPNLANVSVIAAFATSSLVMSPWIKWNDVVGRADNSAVAFRERTTTFAEYLYIKALTIPSPNYP